MTDQSNEIKRLKARIALLESVVLDIMTVLTTSLPRQSVEYIDQIGKSFDEHQDKIIEMYPDE